MMQLWIKKKKGRKKALRLGDDSIANNDHAPKIRIIPNTSIEIAENDSQTI